MKRSFTLFLLIACATVQAQYVVDKQGVLRDAKTGSEAAFFGVNYTVPFAYSYRAHHALSADLEAAIRADVYHLSRLGLDAFRVHVWDTEISDSLGNLLENDHLKLFDFLVSELEKRKIRIIMTPIAFWGNGYPERDEITPGFSRVYGKGRATVNDSAIRAQENYLRQLFRHVNPYTKKTYTADNGIIAVELNNEPSHSGPISGVTAYINRLAAAIRSVGWTKPLFYNISQSPYYASAVAAASIDGVSFQWYPTGLVGGEVLRGNTLPNVDTYAIPFDTIPAFLTKARMVYEFDAADVLASYMYPAIARSFRGAGFQWATQFAYDPMALAYANTEYQTHYLNLAYTPSKAISLLIASEAFHHLPRGKSYGGYPADSVFGPFRVSYRQSLSEMNTADKFYYSNTTSTPPVDVASLTHIAGVGSSPVVHYFGTGAYFLDKLGKGIWRLEVMPDVMYIRDPFAKASPRREVTRVQWDNDTMRVALPDLGERYTIRGINEGNKYVATAAANTFAVAPGTYVLSESDAVYAFQPGVNDFFAPKPYSNDLFAMHIPFPEVTAGHPFVVSATIAGLDTGRAWVLMGRTPIPLVRQSASLYTAEIPGRLVNAGKLTYKIILHQGSDWAAFPGDSHEDPFAWDNTDDATYSTTATDGPLEIYNPATDRTFSYPPFRRGSAIGLNGFQTYFGGKRQGRPEDFQHMYIRARGSGKTRVKIHVTLTDANAFSYGADVSVSPFFQDIEVPLDQMVPDSMLLLPRPYPGFQPLWFKASGTLPAFSLGDMERLQVTATGSFEVASVWMDRGGSASPEVLLRPFISAPPEKVRITPQGDHVITSVHNPSITPFLPDPAKATGVAVIIAPGGGHAELWITHEGYNPARWFQERGIAAFVLKYRLAKEPGSTYSVDTTELSDIQAAIRLVRSRAAEWGIDTARIGVMGFSAGGELAALSAMRFDSATRPAFQALIYPGRSFRFEVAPHAPPVFLVGGYQDRPNISEGIAQVYLKYKAAGVPAELHIYSGVGHGFGMRSTNGAAVAGWSQRFLDWLQEIGIL